jgi:hypothetical protein
MDTATAACATAATASATVASAVATLAPDVRLTPEQMRFFDTFGYLMLPGAVADIIDDISEAFEQVWSSRGGGHDGRPHDQQRRSSIVPFIDQSAFLSALLDHPRVHGAACSLLGDDFNYTGSDGNLYVGDTAWHRDNGAERPRFIKIAFYLDRLSAAQGALRVVPGSQRIGDVYSKEAQAAASDPVTVACVGSTIPAMALEVTPGDVVIFNHATLHSSWGGGTQRRMFTMNCCQRYTQERIGELQQYLIQMARFFIDRNVGPEMLRTATPGRMRHLDQVMANDFLIAPNVARYREMLKGVPSRD